MTDPLAPTLVAFYLPQFHPIPENDEWWGKGFTEWTNVTRARPLFRGHEQPHLPADLGFTDLRVPEVRERQAELARAHGITAFCYYHYWFAGRRLLERPFAEVLASGRPDLSFCLCWANESWTRTWDGRHGHALVSQRYSEEDDRAHIRWLAQAFADPRYLRVDGRPLLLVYKAGDLPDPRRTAEVWREEAARLGVEDLALARVESNAREQHDPAEIGFDVAVEFQPDWAALRGRLRQGVGWRAARRLGVSARGFAAHRIYDYDDVVTRMLAKPGAPYARIPCVTPRWDNTPRRATGATILHRARPESYGRWLEAAIRQSRELPAPWRGLVFVNAWNEWAEGNHLEPCQRWGRAHLDATREAIERSRTRQAPPEGRPGRRPLPAASALLGRATRSLEFRAARARRRSRLRARELLRPWGRILDRLPQPPARRGGAAAATAPAVFVCVYRQRNAAAARALAGQAQAAGWRVALWALDAPDPELATVTVGTGPGTRLELLNRLVAEAVPKPDEWVVVADDDVAIVAGELPSLVAVAVQAGLGLAQPAHSRSSYYTWGLTVRRWASVARRTGFIEIGPVVAISPAWRDRVLPLPEDFGMGWGLELLWSDLAEEGCPLGIVDAVAMRHLDPIATTYDHEVERQRVKGLLHERGLPSLEALQRTEDRWWRGRRPPRWS